MARGDLFFLAAVLILLAGAAPPSDGAKIGLQHGMATWTRTPDGKGNQDGACGYGDNVAKHIPFMNIVTGFGRDHVDCGVCYRITCTSHAACSKSGVRVTVTDRCRAAACAQGASLFDMTGMAFNKMAETGREEELLAVGLVAVQYQWEECFYSPVPPRITFPAFRVVPGATNKDFAVYVVFVDGMAAGNLMSVHIKNSGEDSWHPMYWNSEENKWNFTSGYLHNPLPVKAPMSLKVQIPHGDRPNEIVTAPDVIPVGWTPGATYYPLPTQA